MRNSHAAETKIVTATNSRLVAAPLQGIIHPIASWLWVFRCEPVTSFCRDPCLAIVTPRVRNLPGAQRCAALLNNPRRARTKTR